MLNRLCRLSPLVYGDNLEVSYQIIKDTVEDCFNVTDFIMKYQAGSHKLEEGLFRITTLPLGSYDYLGLSGGRFGLWGLRFGIPL